MLQSIRALVGSPLAGSLWSTTDLIREEQFGIERLERHAQSLAAAQGVTSRPGAGRSLSGRLRANRSSLLAAYRTIGKAMGEGRAITPAAECLADNYRVVEDQIREIHEDLPPGYYRQLPKLADGPFEGYPRVFGLAWAFVAHTDSRFDPEALERFVRAYQTEQALTIGELWAVAITLRIVLVENLRRASEEIVRRRAAREEADTLADRLLKGKPTPAQVDRILNELGQAPLNRAFAVQLLQRLRDQDPLVSAVVRWLDERLTLQGATADDLVREEHLRQGAMNVTVNNVIASMRRISAVDWTELVEGMSLVDAALRAGSDFALMDFPTRDRYRRSIEELARGCKHDEVAIAGLVLAAARRSHNDPPPSGRAREPGWFLIAGGRRAFEAELGYRAPFGDWMKRTGQTARLAVYLGGIAALTVVLLALALAAVASLGVPGWALVLLAVLGSLPASDAAIALVNRTAARCIGPTTLPALELKDGVPASLRTMVVVPTLLLNQAAIAEQIERLEVLYLGNAGGDIRFALLTDWTDAVAETVDGDAEMLAAVAAGVAILNQRHGRAPDGDRFLLLHRRRAWNAGQARWLGWERKRGKLHELNRWMRGALDTSFIGDEDGLPPVAPLGVRYVITLDSDTRLPRGAAARLVGKLAHPLNRPVLDATSGRVLEGYGVLQPRVTPSWPLGLEGSRFQRAFSSASGIDPYTAAVSDVYQDLFGEGSYSGKGIYDVDAFEAALAGRIPENTLLSHDLLEGIFARAALVTDIEVVEEFPARYDAAAARQHRWARGDWQLLPWVLGNSRGDARAAIPLIGRWKLLDNLRRTLSAPVAYFALTAGLALPPAAALAWCGMVLASLALPAVLPVLSGLLPRSLAISKRSHARAVGRDVALAAAQTAFLVTTLPYQAWSMLDAIGRTMHRLHVSRLRLLEWLTAAQAKVSPRLDLRGFYRQMAGGVVLAGVTAAVVVLSPHASLLLATPLLTLWLLSPAVARWVSLPPPVAGQRPLSAESARQLRLIARQTWRYFATFVTAEEHMLPPDNFQEDPTPAVAHRTSPTNIGLYLLAVVAARDFGWLGTVEAIERLEATLATMRRLERFRGHLYNWYDTRNLEVLAPRYVSSVDSGNLAGHLVALRNACLEMLDCPMPVTRWRAGIGDGLDLVRDALAALTGSGSAAARLELRQALDLMDLILRDGSTGLPGVADRLAQLEEPSRRLGTAAAVLANDPAEDPRLAGELLAWVEAALATAHSHGRDQATATRTVRAAASPPGGGVDITLSLRLTALADSAGAMFDEMEFDFLLDPERQLLSLGYRVPEAHLDRNCYDFLASEARLASFIAIAKGDLPAKHWFRLGRAVTPVDRGAALISWSGSMFEYLMPSLVMRAPTGSLLELTSRLVVHRQMSYATKLGVPWGISESAYSIRDLELTYQYSNFGVPDLGIERGLGDDLVIAPYATALAAMVDPEAAATNYARLALAGGRGRFGWYEALDYTAARLPAGVPVVVVRAYMAHHHGMTLVAIANALHEGAMRRRFHAEPIVQATELLLQERPPRDVAVLRPRAAELEATVDARALAAPMVRRHYSPHDTVPRTHLLSNGRYAVMLTAAGSGYSRWRDQAVTRWREDVTRDPWGSYIYVRDTKSAAVWSATYQPTAVEPDDYEVLFAEDRAEFVRRDGSLTTVMDVVVSPDDDAEVRRVSVTNLGSRTREIELTSFAEIVLATAAADNAHPAFSKLFVQTEFVAGTGTLLATRRRRSPDEAEIWAAHRAVVQGETVGELEYETDRGRFLGRSLDTRTPAALAGTMRLSNTVGTVLDPVFSLRQRLRIPPGGTARVAFWTLVAPTRQEALNLADKYLDGAAFERALTLAWTQAQVQMHHVGIGPEDANVFQRLANHVLYADPSLRPSSEVLRRNRLGPSALWPLGISGDLPIVLARIDEAEDLGLIRQLFRAHTYWRLKQLAVDVVILNERPPSYLQDMQGQLEALARASASPTPVEGGGGGRIVVLRADLMTPEVMDLLNGVARAVIVTRRGSLADQIRHLRVSPAAPQPPSRSFPGAGHADKAEITLPELELFNGLGGFDKAGGEYVTLLAAGRTTPAPWINVVCNPSFGFQVSAEGSGYTWSLNSKENQLTAWSNDPVGDPPGEVIYLRDEATGEVWTPTALPIRLAHATYVARHGHGYSRFEHVSHGIGLDLLQFVPVDDPVKIVRLRVDNRSGRTRHLSVTAYVEWVLGPSRAAAAPFIVTAMDPATGAMLATNRWRTEFGDRVAFMDFAGNQTSWSGDRKAFIGRNGVLASPAALVDATPLDRRVGAGLDPCGALQTRIALAPHAVAEVLLVVGDAPSTEAALALVHRYRSADLEHVLKTATEAWDGLLGAVQVRTPDRAMDILLNGWLLYQTLACRIWARSAFYQASGAYGFRDQLQDVMALTSVRPDLVRAQILRAAARQFEDGDVQHWWLPPSGRGVRTRISDDLLWLPYVVAHYVAATGDQRVLDERVPFLEGPRLAVDQHETFDLPRISDHQGTVYEHCARAIDRSLAVGAHGLPLMGTGDWNDGMNRVGAGGTGESVWLGWFLGATIGSFAPLAGARGQAEAAARWRHHAAGLRTALERDGWDGGWYRRGYYDDGTPLGSAESDECRIDAIAQSWAVISGMAEPARAARGMDAVEDLLVDRTHGVARLFAPPFDRTPLDPGYIKGYPPGIRENGGQYTHAALWSVIALAMQGEGDRAAALFALLNPINHATDRVSAERYRIEPYVVAADVYGVAPHAGRGGWSWYTGSAGWMYRAGLQWLLGVRIEGGSTLLIDPCIHGSWSGFDVTVRHRSARYEISVENPRKVSRKVTSFAIDGGEPEPGPARVALLDDGSTHRVRVVLG